MRVMCGEGKTDRSAKPNLTIKGNLKHEGKAALKVEGKKSKNEPSMTRWNPDRFTIMRGSAPWQCGNNRERKSAKVLKLR